jgi:ABC-2 type transport system ATP-binding protein
MLPDLRAVRGARDVSYVEGRFTVHGDREIIARVGAELVRRDRIPQDLTVEIPNLESALLGLLDGRSAPTNSSDLIGASR